MLLDVHGFIQRHQRLALSIRFMAALLLCFLMAGCASEGPHSRLGCLPCPGAFTLYALGDPDHLGNAHYSSSPQMFEDTENGHGILYTERAGFLDLSHLREAMDWSWFATQRVREALTQNRSATTFQGRDKCMIRVFFHYPDDWNSLPPEEHARLVTELSFRIGERIAFNALTWHEITTWFGYASTLVVSEKGSAFTYEDTMSHVVGIAAADRAMRSSTGSWDHDATRCLSEELDHVGVVSMKRAADAVKQVKGKWWSNGVCTRRMLDVGLYNDYVYPWLLSDSVDGPGNGEASPRFKLPALNDVEGRDFTGFWSMTIEPTVFTPTRVMESCQDHPDRINPETHFPTLIELIRSEMRAEFGPHADQPNDHWRTVPRQP